jgi:hypothetical protein
MKKAKIIQRERAIVIEYDDEAIATQMSDSFIAKVNGEDIPSDWVGLSEAAEILFTTRRRLYEKIQQCEADRRSGTKANWKLGKHYHRRGSSGNWQVNCQAISKDKN